MCVHVQSKRCDKINAWIFALAIDGVSVFFFLRVPFSEWVKNYRFRFCFFFFGRSFSIRLFFFYRYRFHFSECPFPN